LTYFDNTEPWELQYSKALRTIDTHGKYKHTRQKSKLPPDRLKELGIEGEFLQTRGISSAVIYIGPDEFPLLTLRPLGRGLRMFIGELLAFLAGSNQIELLNKYGVTYWNDWATAAMIERAGLPPGCLGLIYGPQWRDFRGRDGKSYDQIKELLWKLRNEPYDKRMIVMAYNPADSHKPKEGGGYESAMPVRTCHGNFELCWDGEGTVDMNCWQVSADMPLGIPSNLAMYKALLIIICKLTGMKPGVITYNMVDTHYYNDQVDGVRMLLDREPRNSPTVTFSEDFYEVCRLIMEEDVVEPLALDKFNHYRMPWIEWLMREVTVEGYEPHKIIPYNLLPVAV
jgi:thymidylate synthase